MKDRSKAVQLTASMLRFPAPPSKEGDDAGKDRTTSSVSNNLSDAVQELARQHPRARVKAKA